MAEIVSSPLRIGIEVQNAQKAERIPDSNSLDLKIPLQISSIITGILAIVVLGFISAWAQGGIPASNDDGPLSSIHWLLGSPQWNTNQFAWHPVLMTAYFVTQVFAFLSWVVITSSHDVAKIFHVIFHLAGISTMVAGMVAVVQEMNANGPTANLTTMHHFAGVASIIVFGLNFLLGSTMGVYTAATSAEYRQAQSSVGATMLIIHRTVG